MDSPQDDGPEFIQNNGSWSQGVRSGRYVALLPNVATIEANVIGVPTFALNSRSASAVREIRHEWVRPTGEIARFNFIRGGDTPFPIVQHAFYFDILLAMFAHNFREDGVLKFKFSDVLRNAGKKPGSTGGIVAIKETIKRYIRSFAEWQLSFDGREQSWVGHFIVHSSINDDDCRGVKRNPGNTRNSDDSWHEIKFGEYIVQSISDRKVRLVLTDVLKSGLSAETYCVYRYFKRFSDNSEIRRGLGQIKKSLNCNMRDSKFKVWLLKNLNKLLNSGFIEYFEINELGVRVKLKTLRLLKSETAIKKAKKSMSDAVIDVFPRPKSPARSL